MRNNIFRKGLIIAVLVLFIGVSVAPITVGIEKNIGRNDWWDLDWAYRKEIIINHDMVAGDLQNFPVLVHNISSDFHEHAQFDGDDFVFVSEDHNDKYNHEIEYYNGSSGELVAWVKIPNLYDNMDTIIYLYYSNPNCANQQDPDYVWDSNFIHVWHLGDNLEDSAGSDDGTNYGTDIVSGKVGKARDFEKNDSDYINCGDMVQPADGTLTTMTWEGWVNPETQDTVLMTKYDTSGTDYVSYHLSFKTNGELDIWVASAWGVTTHGTTDDSYAVIGEWIYLTATFNLGGLNDLDAFINGYEVAFTQSTSSANVMKDITVSDDIGRGRYEDWTDYADGMFDEIRWSKVVRSDAWIKTSFNTMNDSSSFLSVGTEEDQNFNHAPNIPSNPIPLNGATGVNLDANFSWTCSDPDGDLLTYDVYFGTNSPPPLVSSNQSGTVYDPGVLQLCTTYYWQIVAIDVYGATNIGPIWSFITRCTGAPNIPDINGPHSGNIGITYSYTFVSIDPDGDDVFYQIDWGDGTFEDWFGPFDSNEIISKDYVWDEEGDYTIKARAKDEFDAIGEWGTYSVTIPRYKAVYNSMFHWFLEHFPLLERLLSKSYFYSRVI